MTEAPNPTQRPPQPDRPYVVSLRLDARNAGTSDVAKKLRDRIGVKGDQSGQTANGKVRLYVIGQGALSAAAAANTKHDIANAERWNLPIILMVLVAVFGSLAAAAIPLALAVCTVVITMGLVFVLSMHTTMSVFVTSTVSMFGIALAVDYSLFILMRYREELRCGRRPPDAVDAAMATSGLAVVLSGMTVIASLTGIYLINTPALRSMATGAILAVAVAMLTSATLTPAVLATFARAAAKRSALVHWSRRPASTQSWFWSRWVGWVMRRPWITALAASTVLLVMAAPATLMVLGNSLLRQFDSSHEIRTGAAAAAQALGPGALGPVQVLVRFDAGGASAPEHSQTIAAIRHRIAQAPNVVSVAPPRFADDNGSALLSAVLSVDPEDLGARDTITWMRTQLPRVAGAAQVDVGGPTALIKDFDDRVSATQPLVLVFVAVIAFLMLLISIRSVFLAFKGVLMTLLSVAAAYGSLVMVFQWGWARGLGFPALHSIDSTVPPLVLAMTFGLSMDYEIFLLTRIRERFLQTGQTRDAVAYGVRTSARTITSAALIMIAVFCGFAFAGMPLVAEIGVACAVAIAVDATVVRLVLVPALMAMFDRWNWWLPRWLAHILPSSTSTDRCRKSTSVTSWSFLTTSPRRSRPARMCGWCSSRRPSSSDLRRTPFALPIRSPSPGVDVTVRRSTRCSWPTATASPGRYHGASARCTRSPCGASGSRSPSTRFRQPPGSAGGCRLTGRAPATGGAARWRRPTSHCPPVTACRSQPARKRCASRAT